jgi:hypothetical protein
MPRSFTDHVKLVNKRHREGKSKCGIQEYKEYKEFKEYGASRIAKWAMRRGFWGWCALDFEDEDDDEDEDEDDLKGEAKRMTDG